MRPLNDDMEDLIRRAASDYPLDVSGADWQKVQHAMNGSGKRKRRWLLLLLLPLIGLGYLFVENGRQEPLSRQTLSEKIPGEKLPTVENATKTTTKEQNDVISETTSFATGNSPLSTETPAILKKRIQKTITSGNILAIAKKQVYTALEVGGSETENIASEYPDVKKDLQPMGFEMKKHKFYIEGPSTELLVGNFQFKNDAGRERATSKNSFYAGLFGGMDATSIKSQGFDQAGYFFGAMVGYYFTERLSVETGIFSTRKYYFTSGQYFDKSKLAAPASWRIKDVEGNCRMLEIPLNIRYDFVHAHATSWFGAAGIRSYLMQKEYYDYNAVYSNGTSGYHDYTYTKGSQHVAAELSVSAGMQQSLGHWANLRVEPFVQLPLHKVGVGRLPFTNVGVQIGLSKKLN